MRTSNSVVPAGRALFALALAAGSILMLAPAQASVIRCRDAEGRISYQDSTCPNGAPGVPVDANGPRGARFATEQQIREAKKALKPEPAETGRRLRSYTRKSPPHRRLTGDAAERRFVSPGASLADVRARIGDPDFKERAPPSRGGKKSGAADQLWIYLPLPGDPQTTTSLTIRNGLVTKVDRRVTY